MKNIAFLFFSFFVLSVRAEDIPLSFEELPKYLEAQNGNISSANLLKKSADELTGHLGRSFLPEFSASVGQEKTSGNPYNKNDNSYQFGQIGLSVNLFRGYRDTLEESMRKTQAKLNANRIDQTKYDLLTSIRFLYWQLLYQQEVIGALELALELNKKNQSTAEKRISGGIATATDRLDFKQAGIQFEQDLEIAKIEYENAKRKLAATLGYSTDVNFLTSKIVPHDHALDSGVLPVNFKFDEHRDFKSLGLQEEIASLNKRRNARWWAPELDLYASKGQKFERVNGNAKDFDDGDVIGLKFTFQFDRLEGQIQSQALAYQELANQELKKQRARELSADYTNALRLYELNHKLIHTSEENIKESEQYLRNTRDEYNRGIKNSPDVLQASQRLVTAKLRYADVKKDYQIARSTLMGLIGI